MVVVQMIGPAVDLLRDELEMTIAPTTTANVQ